MASRGQHGKRSASATERRHSQDQDHNQNPCNCFCYETEWSRRRDKTIDGGFTCTKAVCKSNIKWETGKAYTKMVHSFVYALGGDFGTSY